MRHIAVVGAPSSIGLRPHDETGTPQEVNRAPGTLRDVDVVERLDATDLGDVLPPPYEDFERPPGKARNEVGVATYSRSLADRIAACLDDDRLPVVIGGDCSIVLGCILGASRAGRDTGHAGRDTGSDRSRIGLAYVDGHADFASPEESMTGSVASMGLALAVGRGESPLARLAGPVPLVRGGDVALIGRRDQGQSYGHEALAVSGILDLPWTTIAPDGATVRPTALADTASTVLDRVAANDVAGFWIPSTPTCSTPRSCLRSGRPSRAGRTSTSWPRCSRHWSPTRTRSAWRSPSTTPHSTPIDRPRAGWWNCSRRRSTVGNDMPRRLEIVGAPSSAGAYAPGQERAPAAYRAAGLPALLAERGIAVTDRGDVPGFRWRIDPEHMRAMNGDAAAGVARAVADQVAAGLSDGSAMLVLGGDCTVELGTVAGASRETPDVGLVYIDYDTDLNTPLSVEDGALDWMGVAHLLGLPDTVPGLAGVGPRTPMLRPDQVLLFANGSSTDFERRTIDELGIEEVQLAQVNSAPAGSARGVVDGWARPFERLLVHVDADVLDFLDFPIAEETRRYKGLRFEQLVAALRELVAAPNWTTLTICEVNPDHDSDGSSMRRLSGALADVLSGAPGLAG